jgi:hypothetical protein
MQDLDKNLMILTELFFLSLLDFRSLFPAAIWRKSFKF